MVAKIFLAHAREDKAQVRRLYADLKARGLDPWLDEKELRAGQIWKVEIPKAIHAARLFLACLSSRSVRKIGYVQVELREALAAFGERPPGSIYVVPVRLDECEVPDLQIPNLGLSLQDIHWVDLWQDGGFERLVSDLQHALGGATQAHREEAPTPIPALEQEAEPRAEKETREQAKPVEAKVSGGSEPKLGKVEGTLDQAPVFIPDQKVSEGPPKTPPGKPAPEREPKGRGSPLWRNPTVVAAIVGAIGVVVAALVPWIEKISDGSGRRNQEAQETTPAKPVKATAPKVAPKSVPMTTVTEAPVQDCDDCPVMVAVPAGFFIMGSEDFSQWPQHEVLIAQPFAVGKYEVTFDEWSACVKSGGCNGYMPSDSDWGRGRRPVIYVSWDDAQAYVAWLSKKTGKPYRLLSEAEWEYAARAKTKTRYWWSDDPPTLQQANFGHNVRKTTEVGSYPANPWGLYDMNGNVWEWVEDCWHDNYQGSPSDGSAWMSEKCSSRVLRGGSWAERPENLRSAIRLGVSVTGRGDRVIGFRVARTLSRSES